ncbi:TniQ family protein [Paenibacillus sp. GP183]|uniref:TniQ family protein n=1 Tax=Paenibacillus sp. GP183 TaxID=1882751 RepID=UPI0008992636|nr:TniQ family protein [Paenibacillus sp. GP183]SEC40968.1 transcriptional regulator, TetR family [Paenibacillus sp. GP183]
MDPYAKLEIGQEEIILPAISTLYCLQPMGLNTMAAESLTSYIARQSQAHCIKTGNLFSRLLFPYLDKEYMNQGGSGFYTSAHLINGLTKIATEFVDMLRELTLSNILDQLTLLRYKNVIPTRGLLRRNKAWCPLCFQEMREQKLTVYEPLMWMLQALSVCMKHDISLQEICPHCSNTNLVLEGRSAPGYCSNCSSWLGSREEERIQTKANEWELCKGRLIKDLLSSEISDFKRDDVKWTLMKLAQLYTNDNISGFAKFIGVPKTSFWGWYTGKNLPTLEDVMRICNKCDISLGSFYSGNRLGSNSQYVISAKRIKKENFILTQKSVAEVGRIFKQLVLDRKNMRINVTSMAKEVQVNKKTLYKYFGPICKQQTRMNRYYKVGQKNLRIIKLSGEISKAFSSLFSSGLLPTVRRIEIELQRPAILREKKMSRHYKLCREVFNI